MARRRTGQEALVLPGSGQAGRGSTLDQLAALIDWAPVEVLLKEVYAAAKGEPAWPPLALFRALLIAVWHDLADVNLAEALDDRASYRRFCGSPATSRCRSARALCASAKLCCPAGWMWHCSGR